jgi:NAD(P)H-flavin reductase
MAHLNVVVAVKQISEDTKQFQLRLKFRKYFSTIIFYYKLSLYINLCESPFSIWSLCYSESLCFFLISSPT